MHEDKKDKYKKFQTKTETKKPKGNKLDHKDASPPGESVRNAVNDTKKANTKSRASNDFYASTQAKRPFNQTRRAFDDGTANSKSTAPKIKYEAGSGSLPSGTNTNLPNWGKRKDGSSGPC